MNAPSLVNGPFADDLFPFTLTRSAADIRCGILTIREKWNLYLKNTHLFKSVAIYANIIPNPDLVQSLFEYLEKKENNPEPFFRDSKKLSNPLDILLYNASEIKKDFDLITAGRRSATISTTNKLIGDAIFLETGATVEHCYINATDGPVYVGKDALIMEGSMIRGPFAIGEKGTVKMGAKIYGATSVGPHCVLGGEIKNSVLFGYSNKAHDGYLGDSIIGEWCNLGAGTTNSNIKNSGGEVRLWNPLKNCYTDAGLKCGMMMGDYSRSAIQTAFNTGTVVGASCHVFGKGATPAYLPSFSWGLDGERYDFDKAIQHIAKWKKLKNVSVSTDEIKQLRHIFDQQNKS
jgi:UDP-N-acetylglucosamine diphosphorylase / glucose-1-phosphate thymidylyltransferase / UDP-N-acetylgalactosamine diphosphorylase / glucosamine-1-phosphate N-acetyltransferase / galactosamine-1-phosphate N-acetyltransferase